MNLQKCAIIGVGFVGATVAYTLATSGLFSELVLLDVDRAKAEGQAADISHGVSFAQPCAIHAGDYQDLKDCGLVIIAAGANQKPGENRIDLLRRNQTILQGILSAVTAACPDCILLVVSNPVDVLTYLCQKLSGFPACRVIGTGTVLDTARLKYLVGQYLQVDSRNVHAFIIGEHGDSELAVWSSANISGMDLPDYCRIAGKAFSQSVLDDIYQNVRDAAYHIIQSKGATYYGIGMAVLRIARAIVRDERSVLPVSSVVCDRYGVSEVCLGLPSVVGRNGIETVLNPSLNQQEAEQLTSSAAKLRALLNESHLS